MTIIVQYIRINVLYVMVKFEIIIYSHRHIKELLIQYGDIVDGEKTFGFAFETSKPVIWSRTRHNASTADQGLERMTFFAEYFSVVNEMVPMV